MTGNNPSPPDKPAGGWPRARQLFGHWWPGVATRWLFALPLAVGLIFLAFGGRDTYRLEVTVDGEHLAEMRVCHALATAPDDVLCARGAPVKKEAKTLRFMVRAGEIRSFDFRLPPGPGVVRLGALKIRSGVRGWLGHRVVTALDVHGLQPQSQIESCAPEGDAVRIVVGKGGGDPHLVLALPTPLRLGRDGITRGAQCLLFALGWLALWVLAAEGVRRLPARVRAVLPPAAAVARALRSPGARVRRLSPAAAIWLVSAAGAVLSCYPVVFLGKSFVSPNFQGGSYRLYGKFPTLPGTPDASLESAHDSDVDAMNIQHVEYAAIEGRALLRDHELPLWNRYNYCGLPLIGQGQSMFGDPLHCLVLAAGGAAWAWDGKFVLARWLLSAGVGFLVLVATDCLPAALLLGFSSAFLGFFAYRLNHPAYFSLCYAPWMLYAWLEIVRAPTWRGAMRWSGGLLLANWIEMNSGTAKEAYMLLLCLNLCGALALCLDRRPFRDKCRRFAGLLGAGGIFCLLAAPILLAFFATLQHSMSIYDTPRAYQFQPGMLLGLFDDIFYRQFNTGEQPAGPSANFLVLLGVLLALGSFKRQIRHPVFVAVAISALLPFSLAFGVVSPSVIRAVPVLGNIVAVGNTFSCVLIIHLFVLAGFGFKRCLARADPGAWPLDVGVAFLLGGALLCLFFGHTQAATSVGYPYLEINREIRRSGFFYGYAGSLIVAVLLLPFLLRQLFLRGPRPVAVLLLVGCLFLLHWRLGTQVHTRFSRYTAVLPNRVDLQARSPAIDFLRADQAGPFRTLGLNGSFNVGYGGMVELETIHGPDALFNPYMFMLERMAMGSNLDWVSGIVNKTRLRAEKPFFDLMNIRYCLALPGNGLDEVPGLHKVRALDLDVYRNDNAWPRAFFVDRLGVYTLEKEFAKQVLTGDGKPFAMIQPGDLEKYPGLAERFEDDQAGRTVVAATRYRLTNHRTEFEVQAPGSGLVVLTEAYLKNDVVAKLDGRETPIFRINHAFRGILVDQPGLHRISFDYAPPHFTLALWASGLGLVLLGTAGGFLRRRPADKVAPPLAAGARPATLALS